MKRAPGMVGAALLALHALASSALAQPAGLVAAYGMNQGSGTTVADEGPNGLTGTIAGATWTTSGRFGGALTFDGVNDTVAVADANPLDLTGALTLEAWVYPTTTSGVRDILIKEGTNVDVYNLYARNWRGMPESNVHIGSSNLVAEGPALAANTWTHVAGTYDGTTLRLYLNGALAASTPVTGALTPSTGPLRIGGNSIWGEYFQGRIDEVRVYNRALTPAEIQTDMNTAIGPDVAAPVLSGGSPSGVLPSGTSQTTIAVATGENATCRYATTAGLAFGAMPNLFTTTGGSSHAATVTGLVDGQNYTYYVRCQDTSLNVNTSDYPITFGVAQVGGDTTPPTVAVTSPPDTASVSGMVTVTASAADNVGVAGVRFLLDNVEIGSEVVTPPYTIVWDTSTSTLGPHTLTARARDAAGNLATSAPVAVAVANNPVPTNFADEVVIGAGLTFPTAFDFLPDGRMLITEFRGRVLVVQPNATVVDATPVLQVPNIFEEDVTVGGERGLVNVVADPDFAANGYIYLFYTAASPQRDRVARFTMTGNIANPASELVIWQGIADSTSTDHHGGGLMFGPDGKLYISTGDNGDPPSSQPLSSDHGKILRVNKDGTIPADNPFVDGNGSNVDAIWARGLRNPYRFSFDTVTGKMYIGDVGQNLTEEINIGVAGANYGWPTCEGSCGNGGMTNPIYTYNHNGRDAAVTGGFVYRGTQFPAAFQGVYFHGDFAQNWIRYLTFDASGGVTSSQPFLPVDGTADGPYDPIMLKPGPDGSVYYVDFGWGWLGEVNPASIRRLRYVAGNQPPVVAATATPQTGLPPLTVTFSSAGSFDPEGQALSYLWAFGDGATSSAANPTHVYAQSGLYNATLEVSDGASTTTSGNIRIAVGNTPQNSLTSPANGAVFRAGDVITFAATATDTEDGPLGPDAFTWTILFHHDSHVHPTLGPVSGMTSGTFTIPNTGHDFSGNTFYEILLTTTDSTGLQTTSSVSVFPHKVNLTFNTVPAGLTFTIDGVTRTTPYVKDTLTGFQHAIGAPDQTQGAIAYTFQSWSDGGTQTHGIIAGESAASYTASFHSSTVTAFPTSATVLTGTLSSGTAAALAADDNVYYAVNSTTTGTRTAAWYGSFTGVSNALTSLAIDYKGNNSGNCTQTVAIWSWATSAWVQLDSRTVGTTEVAIQNLTPAGTLADYVSGISGPGELRVRIQCTTTANRISRGDLLRIVYNAPPAGPDTTPPVRLTGQPTGTLPAGTTQTVMSLTTDEAAVCRFGTVPGVAYASLPNVFTTTGNTTHGTVVAGLADGGSYTLYVRCQDGASNANPDDLPISFAVATPPPPDTTAPTVAMTAPADGATVSGAVDVNATAADNVAVVGVQFLLNGAPLGAEDTTAPYSVSWSSSSVANGGPYLLSARARDAAGNSTTATAVSVTVNNTALPGLVAAYGFDDNAGTSASDGTGRGHTATISGAAWTTSGKFGNALSFDGVNDMVTVADHADLDFTTALTLEAWVYPTAIGAGSWRNVMIKERTGSEVYNLYANADTNAPTVYVIRSAQPSTPLDARGTSQLPVNAWSHLAVTFDNGTLRIFVNGVQVGSRAVTGPLITSTGALRIGGNTIWGEFFAGRIDEVRLYNRALGAAEIQTDMNTAVGPAGPDTTPPVRSSGLPSGALPADTTQAVVSLSTNENAICRFGTTPGVPFASLPNVFSATGGTSHSTLVAGLANGASYTLYVRCQDAATNANGDDFPIAFSVAMPPPPDTTAPTVGMTAPADAATVSGVVDVTATAADNVAVVGVQFLLNGAPLGAEDTTAPYAITWTSSSVANGGPYALSARARDAAGNTTTATAVSVTVNNTALPGLVAAYNFDEASGATLTDRTGRAHTGTIAGATWTAAGRFGGALTFDGVDDMVTVPDHADLDLTTALTLEAWVYPTALGSGSWRNVMIKERAGSEVYNLYANADTNAPTVYVIRSAQPNTPLDARGTSQLPVNAWSHLAVTFDNGTLRIFVNGVQVGSRAVTGPLITSTGALRIGGNTVWGEFFAGRIDEVKIYNRALSAAEIQTDMTMPVQP